jgi:hypothetical protein
MIQTQPATLCRAFALVRFGFAPGGEQVGPLVRKIPGSVVAVDLLGRGARFAGAGPGGFDEQRFTGCRYRDRALNGPPARIVRNAPEVEVIQAGRSVIAAALRSVVLSRSCEPRTFRRLRRVRAGGWRVGRERDSAGSSQAGDGLCAGESSTGNADNGRSSSSISLSTARGSLTSPLDYPTRCSAPGCSRPAIVRSASVGSRSRRVGKGESQIASGGQVANTNSSRGLFQLLTTTSRGATGMSQILIFSGPPAEERDARQRLTHLFTTSDLHSYVTRQVDKSAAADCRAAVRARVPARRG